MGFLSIGFGFIKNIFSSPKALAILGICIVLGFGYFKVASYIKDKSNKIKTLEADIVTKTINITKLNQQTLSLQEAVKHQKTINRLLEEEIAIKNASVKKANEQIRKTQDYMNSVLYEIKKRPESDNGSVSPILHDTLKLINDRRSKKTN